MPHPDSSSMSTFTHLRPLLAYNTCSTGLSAVTVVAGPNITCPTSTLTSARAYPYSITYRSTDHVAPIDPPSALPHRHAPRVYDLERVGSRGAQQPRGVITCPRGFTRSELTQQIVVVAEQDEAARVDDRRVVELRVRVPRGDGRYGRFHHRCVAEPRVAVAGRKGARQGASGAGA